MHPEADMSDAGDGCESLDLAHLAAQTGGDPELQRDLLDLFIVQSVEFVAQIQGLGRADPAAAAALAHTIDGSARAIGAFDVAGAAAKVERAFSAGQAPAALGDLVAALDDALTAIEAHIRTLSPPCDA